MESLGDLNVRAYDLPAPLRALSVIVAIALVATAAAPILFTAASIVG